MIQPPLELQSKTAVYRRNNLRMRKTKTNKNRKGQRCLMQQGSTILNTLILMWGDHTKTKLSVGDFKTLTPPSLRSVRMLQLFVAPTVRDQEDDNRPGDDEDILGNTNPQEYLSIPHSTTSSSSNSGW